MKNKLLSIKFALGFLLFFGIFQQHFFDKHDFVRAAGAIQNLDEVMARKARFGTNTFYSGETGSPYYFWQPETLNYADANFGTEVWRIATKPGISDNFSKEYSTQAFNYDGGKMGLWSCVPIWNSPNRRVSGDPNKDGGDCTRWVLNSDGTKFRVGTGRGYSFENPGYVWMNTQSAYLFSPFAVYDPAGGKFGQVYKVSIDANNAMTRQLIYDTDDGRAKQPALKDSLTSDDKWLAMQDTNVGTWPTPNSIDSKRLTFLNLTTNTIDNAWGVARGIGPVGDPYGQDVGTNEVGIRGSSSAFINPGDLVYAHYSNFVPHFLWSRSGSASDGGPLYEDWNGTTFGVHNEIRALDDDATTSTDLPHNPYDNGYMGHPAFDRWGRYVLGDSSHDCNAIVYNSIPVRRIRWGNNGCPGLMVLDVRNNLANPPWFDATHSNYMIGTGNSNVYNASHSSWTGWTDDIVSIDSQTHYLFTNNYQKTSQVGKDNYQAPKNIVNTEIDGFYFDNYAANPRPAQSPDGTKVAFSTIMFHSAYAGVSSDDDFTSTAYVVAYYPHPPFVRSVAATGANVNIRVDWDLSGDAKGYTKRGWPNEQTDTPPPPREIEKFRLWKSADGTNWTAVKTFNHDVWSKYDFANGTWNGNDYWTVSDAPGNGTWQYAVTSIETSGLESKTLSNVFTVVVDGNNNSAVEAQAYPTDPGAKSNFFATLPDAPQNIAFTHKLAPATADGQYTLTWSAPANKDLIRYYNIYAHDGSIPQKTQQMRIASIAATSDYTNSGNFKYVDWLGNTDGSTKYLVTSVDFQGNESMVGTDQNAPSAPTGLNVQ